MRAWSFLKHPGSKITRALLSYNLYLLYEIPSFKVKHGRKRGRKEKEADIVAAHDSDTSNSLKLTAQDASSYLRFSARSNTALVSQRF